MCSFPDDCTPLRIRGRGWLDTKISPWTRGRPQRRERRDVAAACGVAAGPGLFISPSTRLNYARFAPRTPGAGMEAALRLYPGADAPGPPDPALVPPPDNPRRTELLLDALKAAIATPGEHRLFRSGKLAGLFPSRAGP